MASPTILITPSSGSIRFGDNGGTTQYMAIIGDSPSVLTIKGDGGSPDSTTPNTIITIRDATTGDVLSPGTSGVDLGTASLRWNLFGKQGNFAPTTGDVALILASSGTVGSPSTGGLWYNGTDLFFRNSSSTFNLTTTVTNSFVQNGNSFAGLATIGTNDNYPFAIEANAVEVARFLTNSSFGVGTTTKMSQFTVVPTADVSNIGGTTAANATTAIVGSGTTFTTKLGIGDRISLSSAATTYATVTAIADDTHLTLSSALGNGASQTINRKASALRVDDSSSVTRFIVNDQGYIGIGSVAPTAKMTLGGNMSIPAWGLIGSAMYSAPATFTDTSTANSGTATSSVIHSFGQPTIAASNTSVTTTEAATVYIANSPTAGTNQTITSAYSLWTGAGSVKFDHASALTSGSPVHVSKNLVFNPGAGSGNPNTDRTILTLSPSGAQSGIAISHYVESSMTTNQNWSGSIIGSKVVGTSLSNGAVTTANVVSGNFVYQKNTGSGTVTTAHGVLVQQAGTHTGVTTNYHGLHVEKNYTSGTITNAYGIYLEQVGNLGSGTTNGSSIFIESDGTAKTGITMGTSAPGDTNLYRQTGGGLRTDQDFTIGSNKEIHLYNEDNTYYTGLKSYPYQDETNQTYTLPQYDGAPTDALRTDGTGGLYWAREYSLGWTSYYGTATGMNLNVGVIVDNVSLVTLTLPVSPIIGSRVRVVGVGAGGWRLAQNSDQVIHFGNASTTVGTGGRLDSTHRRDCVELVCVAQPTDWMVISSVGNINIT